MKWVDRKERAEAFDGRIRIEQTITPPAIGYSYPENS